VFSKADNKDLILLGAMIRKRRVALKITQAQLAFELGTDGRHIRRIENGDVNISYLTLKKIAESFHIKLSQLIKDTE
jgi:transcriptional regulator with XRE-family HTH domain